MSSTLKNLSTHKDTPDGTGMHIGIVCSEWNTEVTNALFEGAYKTLLKYGVKENNIISKYVPGTFELTLGAQTLFEATNVDAVIVLGCVIQGETRHFDFICQGVAQGITSLNIKYNKPVIFGVLTTDNQQQAMERSGGKHGNKGDEAAYTAIKMIAMQRSF